MLFVPQAALADNECGLQVGTTPIECPSDDYSPDGITYVSVGDLVLNLEPISAFGTSLGSGGLNISAGALADSLTVTTERIASARHTAPVVVDLSTQAGDISLDSSTSSVSFPDIQGNFGATEYGVRAISGSGSIELNLGGVTATGTPGIAAVYAETGSAGSIGIATARTVSGRDFGIQAVTGSGGINLTTNGTVTGNLAGIQATSGSGDVSIETNGTVGSFSTVQYGILAETGGTGSLTITASGTVQASNNAGVAAIDATTGTGLLTIDVASGSGNIAGAAGTGIRVNAGGDVVIDIASGRRVTAFNDTVLDLTAAGDVTLNNNGEIVGALDFSGLASGYTFNNNAGAVWDTGFSTSSVPHSDLGAGAVNNAGTIELRSGRLVSAAGATFTGIDDGTLLLSGAILDGHGQADCLAPTVTGCLDLTGGATAGQTEVLVVTSVSAPSGPPFLKRLDNPVSPGIVVVDVGGGTSQADHFVLSPDSFATSGSGNVEIYAEDPVYGAVLKTGGLFDYALLYNPNTQQHLLSSVPQSEALEYAALIHESLSVWHTTSDVVAGRQADLRDGGERGGWIRVFTDQTERDFKPSVTTHGNTFNYDRGYELDTRGVVAGYDMTADENHVFGVHLGFMSTRLEHDDSPTVDETTFPSSVIFGVYSGWWNDSGLTLDGTLNVNLLDIEHDVRDGLEDTRTNVITTGIRAEAGWRFPLAESFYVQPLATAAYVYADVERLDMRDYDAKFEDEQSMRVALGVRLGGDMALNSGKVGKLAYWLTARAWEEYADDGRVEFATGGDPLVIADDISGSFEEIGLGVEATNQEGNLSAYFSTGATFGDDADNYNVSVGARLNW